MAIPKNLTFKDIIRLIKPRHVLKALARIDREGVPPHRESTRFDLMHNRKAYPPKYVLALASRYATGDELPPWAHNGGKQTNDPLMELEFEIRTKKGVPLKPMKKAARTKPVGNKSYKTLIADEGEEWIRYAKTRWRSSALVRDGKEFYKGPDGKLRCHACGFTRPDSIKYEIVQLHHKKPMREGKRISTVDDLVPLCPTCHCMAHSKNPPMTVSKLKKLRGID